MTKQHAHTASTEVRSPIGCKDTVMGRASWCRGVAVPRSLMRRGFRCGASRPRKLMEDSRGTLCRTESALDRQQFQLTLQAIYPSPQPAAGRPPTFRRLHDARSLPRPRERPPD